MALQLYHGYGSKDLIETIHAFDMCASYTEVRQFLTSATNHEIAKTEVSCIPYRISPKTLGGDFIQEGADNIDLNTETIDGKNTMHSMARAVFSGGARSYTNFRNQFNQNFHTNKSPFYSINCFNSEILSAIATILSLKLLEILILYCTSFYVT